MDDNFVDNLEEAIKNKDGFKVTCKKCGSENVVVFGEPGMDGSEFTGYMSGEMGLKCKDCGNAKRWDD